MQRNEQEKLAYDLHRFCNDRARLQYGLELTLKELGMSKLQVYILVTEVRKANFEPLKNQLTVNLYKKEKYIGFCSSRI